MTLRRTRLAALLVAPLTIVGCGPANPSFNVSETEAYRAFESMAMRPVAAERPVLILGGFGDPGIASGTICDVMQSAFSTDEFIVVRFTDCENFDDCRARVIAAVDATPSSIGHVPGETGETIEVDVIGNSMGGLVARYAAIPADRLACGDGRRLKIRRLYTISTPHRGAALARLLEHDDLVGAMCAGSHVLELLDQALSDADYELVCYCRLNDEVVGTANTAPPGMTPYWLPTPPLQFAHLLAYADRRILADIAHRLRNEPPFTSAPPAPLPID